MLSWGSDRKHLCQELGSCPYSPPPPHCSGQIYRPRTGRGQAWRVQGISSPALLTSEPFPQPPTLRSLMLWSAEALLKAAWGKSLEGRPKVTRRLHRRTTSYPQAARTRRRSPTGRPGNAPLKARFASRCLWSRQRKGETRALGS